LLISDPIKRFHKSKANAPYDKMHGKYNGQNTIGHMYRKNNINIQLNFDTPANSYVAESLFF
jgi:hypothetical protein